MLTDPLARAVFDHITRDVDVDEAAVADYHARNPRRFARARGADGWLRPPDPTWASTRCVHIAALLRGRPGGKRSGAGSINAAPSSCCWPRLRAPGDPRQPDNTHKH